MQSQLANLRNGSIRLGLLRDRYAVNLLTRCRFLGDKVQPSVIINQPSGDQSKTARDFSFDLKLSAIEQSVRMALLGF